MPLFLLAIELALSVRHNSANGQLKLHQNQALLAKPVNELINDNTLVALALLVAESLPEQKELMIRLVEHFILLKG